MTLSQPTCSFGCFSCILYRLANARILTFKLHIFFLDGLYNIHAAQVPEIWIRDSGNWQQNLMQTLLARYRNNNNVNNARIRLNLKINELEKGVCAKVCVSLSVCVVFARERKRTLPIQYAFFFKFMYICTCIWSIVWDQTSFQTIFSRFASHSQNVYFNLNRLNIMLNTLVKIYNISHVQRPMLKHYFKKKLTWIFNEETETERERAKKIGRSKNGSK